MKHKEARRPMPCSALTTSLAACLCLGFATPLLAAQQSEIPPGHDRSATTNAESNMKPAQKCLRDLQAFGARMQKDGYWFRGSGGGYGYPEYGYSAGEPNSLPPVGVNGAAGARVPAVASNYEGVRPGYEIRTLIASANILARRGQQQACESLLSTTRGIYSEYAADLHNNTTQKADLSGWRRQQIAAAQPVSGSNTSLRSDQLIGTDVVSPKGDALGSVSDIVTGPQTGKIAYLVIGRGGFFGIDEKYVPVPWADFKATAGATLLVLDATPVSMAAAPKVKEDQFSTRGDFGEQSQKVDNYWKATLAN